MSRTCDISGKKARAGNTVSHSNRKTKRKFNPNVQSRTLVNPATGKKMKLKISTHALKTLKKWEREGKKVDLRELIKQK